MAIDYLEFLIYVASINDFCTILSWGIYFLDLALQAFFFILI